MYSLAHATVATVLFKKASCTTTCSRHAMIAFGAAVTFQAVDTNE